MSAQKYIDNAVTFLMGGNVYSDYTTTADNDTLKFMEAVEKFSMGIFKDCAKKIIKWDSLIKNKHNVKTVVPTINIPQFINSEEKKQEIYHTIIPEMERRYGFNFSYDFIYCASLLYFSYTMINLRILSAQLPLIFNYLRESLDKKYVQLEYEAYEYEVKPATGKNILVAGIKVIDVFSEKPFRVLLNVEIEGLIDFGGVVKAMSKAWPGQSWTLPISSDFTGCAMDAIAVRFILGTDNTRTSTTTLTKANESDKIKDSAMLAAGQLRWFLTSWLN